jgi:flagellar biosynthesis anti-sigma factor FlgM
MSVKISGIDNRPAPVASGQPVRPSQDVTTGNAPPAPPSAPVQITDAARQLAALEQALKSVPIVNEAKVAQVRKAIAAVPTRSSRKRSLTVCCGTNMK